VVRVNVAKHQVADVCWLRIQFGKGIEEQARLQAFVLAEIRAQAGIDEDGLLSRNKKCAYRQLGCGVSVH
jgi:hypothetical protein